MLAISKRYWFRPQASQGFHEQRLVGLGLQEATTTRLSLCSLIISLIFSWVSWEQVKRFSSA